MTRFPWLLITLVTLTSVAESQAQFLPPPYYFDPFAPNAGIAFQYKTGRLTIRGYATRGLPPGSVILGSGPFVPVYPYPYFAAPPGVVQTRVTVNVYAPQPLLVSPAREYDTTGVDLDLVHPANLAGAKQPQVEPRPEPEPEPKLPGKDVSVPKPPVRPEDKADIKAPPRPPMIPGMEPKFPRPKPPLANPRDQSDRLIGEGIKAFQEKMYGLAAQRLHLATKADPTNDLAYFVLAQCHIAAGRYTDAIAAVHEGMKLRKDYPGINFRPRMSLYRGIELEFDFHLDRLKEVMKQNPKSADLMFLTAHQFWFDGNQPEAQALFQKARPLAADTTYIDRFLNAAKPKVVASS